MASLIQLASVPFFIPGAGQEARMPLAGPYPVHPCFGWEVDDLSPFLPHECLVDAVKLLENAAYWSLCSTVGNTRWVM